METSPSTIAPVIAINRNGLDFNDALPQSHWFDCDGEMRQQSPKPEERLTSGDLKQRLHNRLREALYHLFPAGKIVRNAFMVGNVQGEEGDSLSVELSGGKAGLWHDFATGEGGDIFSLWGAAHGWDHRHQFPDIINAVQDWLGTTPRPLSKKPVNKKKKDLGAPQGKWGYQDINGNLIVWVYRYDGKEYRPWDVKAQKWQAPDPRPLYNQPGLACSDTVVLVEGEKCAEALITSGICATTAMNGANALIDKTDWSPLHGKHVLVWPDQDTPGKEYGDRVIKKLRTLGLASLALLIIPEDKPEKWDAADAITDGLDVKVFMETYSQTVSAPDNRLPAFTVGQLLDDGTPLPEDLVAPRILTPGGLLVFGGAPKVGKTDLLLSWLAHMAAGLPFLGMATPRPLKIFYLQTEIMYDYLRERLKTLAFDPDFLALLRQNSSCR